MKITLLCRHLVQSVLLKEVEGNWQKGIHLIQQRITVYLLSATWPLGKWKIDDENETLILNSRCLQSLGTAVVKAGRFKIS